MASDRGIHGHGRQRPVAFLGAILMALLGLGLPLTAQEAPPPAQPMVAGVLPEPGFIPIAIDFAGRFVGEHRERQRDGFYLTFNSVATGSGWLSVGGGLRHRLLNNRARFDASTAISLRAYTQTQLTFELPGLRNNHVVVGSQVMSRDLTQVAYFGAGPDTLAADRTDYRLTTTEVAGYAIYRPKRWLSIGGRIGYLHRPDIRTSSGPRDPGDPDVVERFAKDPAVGLAEQPSYLHGDASITIETRDWSDHPSRGGLYRASLATYADRDGGPFSFRRYETEGTHLVPLAGGRVAFALHGWAVLSDTSAGQVVPFYLAPTLGGANTLRSYAGFRFHDRHLVLVSAEARLALLTHVDLALFADAGNVAGRFRDLDLSKTSRGVGIRLHTHNATIGRIDVAHGADGWRALFSLDDPFRLGRVLRHAGVAPVIP